MAESVINASLDIPENEGVLDISGRTSRRSVCLNGPAVPNFQGGRRNSSFVRYDHDLDENPSAPKHRVTINIAGLKFDIPLNLLAAHPETLLGNPLKLHRYYDSIRDEYYFNRDRACFESILAYYQSGLLYRPQNTRLDMFVGEAKFFELSDEAFTQFCHDEGFVKEEPEPLPVNPIFRKIWQFVEIPSSSAYAKFFGIFSMLVIVLSIVVFCAETLPQFREPQERPDYVPSNQSGVAQNVAKGYAQFQEPLFIIETACISWFTLEFLLRLITCPNKKKFVKSALNIIDFVAILPYYIDLIIVLVSLYSGEEAVSKGGVLTVLRILRLVRVFRIFKLSRHSRGLQILGQTFAMSIKELGLLLLFLGIGVVLFSSAVFYAEQGTEDTQFTSIPEAFWWAIVTMTTVGYGDVAPRAVFGKLVGTACAVSGLIAVALPVPVIVANFNTIYQRERDRPQIEDILKDVLSPGESTPHILSEQNHKNNGTAKASLVEIEPMLQKQN